MHVRRTGGTTAAADAAVAVAPVANSTNFTDRKNSFKNSDVVADASTVPGVAFISFRRRTVHSPGQQPEHAGMGGSASMTGRVEGPISRPNHEEIITDATTAEIYRGLTESDCSPEHNSSCSSTLARGDSIQQWEAADEAQASGNSELSYSTASTVFTPSSASCPSSPAGSSLKSHKHPRQKWLQSMLKYANPRGKTARKKQRHHQDEAPEVHGPPSQGHQQLRNEASQCQEQIQLQMELERHEQLAFREQFYEQGWDKLPEYLQVQLKQQFQAEFRLQVQQQQQLLDLQAVYPDCAPAVLQQMLEEPGQHPTLEQHQPQETEAYPAAVSEQHMQHDQLQQQLAGLQLPEHVQWLVHDRQQQQQQLPAAAANDMGYFTNSGHFAAAQSGNEYESALVQVLNGPNGQLVQVTPDEFQDILTVMHAIADARHDLAVRLQSSAGGQGTEGGTCAGQQQESSDANTGQGVLAGSISSWPPHSTHASDLGNQSVEAAGHQVFQVSAGGSFSTKSTSQQQQHQQDSTGLSPFKSHNGQLQHPDDCNLLQQQSRSKSTCGYLHDQGDAGAGAPDNSELSYTNCKRPATAIPVKRTLFDFTSAEPGNAAVHYMKPQREQQDTRRKPRPLSGQAFPASQPSLARRNLHLSTPGSCAKASFRGQQKDASVIGPEALLGGRGRPVSRGGALASTEPTDRRRTTGVSTASANGRARSASPSSPGVSEEAKAGARLALQNYRAAFDLIRQRTSSDSNSHTGWTDDDSPKKEDKVPTSFQAACTGTPSSPANTENDRAIEQLKKKVAELEAGLNALLNGQTITPAAAAALMAAISRMRPGSELHASGLWSKIASPGGTSTAGSLGCIKGSRNPSETAIVSAADGSQVNTTAGAYAEIKRGYPQLQQQQQDQKEAADELDSIIKAINEPRNQPAAGVQLLKPLEQQKQQHCEHVNKQLLPSAAKSVQWATESKQFMSQPAARQADNPVEDSTAINAVKPPTDSADQPAHGKVVAAAESNTVDMRADNAADGAEKATPAVLLMQAEDQPASQQQEMKRATGAFDAFKYEAYCKQVSEDMAKRAARHDFDSDIEEEQRSGSGTSHKQPQGDKDSKSHLEDDTQAATAALKVLAEAELKLQQLHEQEERLKAMWAEQEEWMSKYRKPSSQAASRACTPTRAEMGEAFSARHGAQPVDADLVAGDGDVTGKTHEDDNTTRMSPRDHGYAAAAEDEPGGTDSSQEVQWRAAATKVAERRSRAASPLSLAQRAALGKRFVPTVSDEFPEIAAVADAVVAADLATGSRAEALNWQDTSGLRHRAALSDGDSCCPPREESVEWSDVERNAVSATSKRSSRQRRKRIAAVKLEQDLELKACEEAALLQHRFVAQPVPRSSKELRYHQLMALQHARRAATHQRYLQLIAAQQQPFSFQEEDALAAADKATRRAAAQDPNRFQRRFKAKPVPSHVHERRYESLMESYKASKLSAKVKAEMARERVAEVQQASRAERSSQADRSCQALLEASEAAQAKAIHRKPRMARKSSRQRSRQPVSRDSEDSMSPASEVRSSERSWASHAHPFASAAVNNTRHMQGNFPVLHTTYSTDESSRSDGGWSSTAGSLTSHDSNTSLQRPLHSRRGLSRLSGGVDCKAAQGCVDTKPMRKTAASFSNAVAYEMPSTVVPRDMRTTATQHLEPGGALPRTASDCCVLPLPPAAGSGSALQATAAPSASHRDLQHNLRDLQSQSSLTGSVKHSLQAANLPRKAVDGSQVQCRQTKATRLKAQATTQLAMLEGKYSSNGDRQATVAGASPAGRGAAEHNWETCQPAQSTDEQSKMSLNPRDLQTPREVERSPKQQTHQLQVSQITTEGCFAEKTVSRAAETAPATDAIGCQQHQQLETQAQQQHLGAASNDPHAENHVSSSGSGYSAQAPPSTLVGAGEAYPVVQGSMESATALAAPAKVVGSASKASSTTLSPILALEASSAADLSINTVHTATPAPRPQVEIEVEQQQQQQQEPAEGAALPQLPQELSEEELRQAAAVVECSLTAERSSRGCRSIPPVAAPAKSPLVLPLQRVSSTSSPGPCSPVRPLEPSVLPKRQASYGSSEFAKNAGEVLKTIDAVPGLPQAALAEVNQAAMAPGSVVSAAKSNSSSTCPATAATPLAAAAGTACKAGSGQVSTAVQPAFRIREAKRNNVDQEVAHTQQQQPILHSTVSADKPPAPRRSASGNTQAMLASQGAVVVSPQALTVKERVKAINTAAKHTSAANSSRCVLGKMRSEESVDSEASGSYKPCHSWGRAMGVMRATLRDGAASRAHATMVEQLCSSQVGTVVERRRMPLERRQDAPLLHIEARHAQAEQQARKLVDEALRAHGVKNYQELFGDL